MNTNSNRIFRRLSPTAAIALVALSLAFLAGCKSRRVITSEADEAWQMPARVEVDGVTYIHLVDTKPTFNGSNADVEFQRFAYSRLVYPQKAVDERIEGRVIVEFIIDAEGSLTNARIVRSVHPLLDNEVLRVVRLSPKWSPGVLRGQPVRVRYQMPFAFALPPEDETEQNNTK